MSFLDTLVSDRIQHLFRRLVDSEYRQYDAEVKKLWHAPRYESGETTLLGPPTRYVDGASFLSAYRAIFEDEIYAFEPETRSPVILDGGANVGLATLYWKRRLPDADVTAFEPDPQVFDILRWNVREHGYDDVELHQKGLWSDEGVMPFDADGGDAGNIAKVTGETARRGNAKEHSVAVVELAPFLNRQVDLLKLDIEGAEVEVLRSVQSELERVEHVFVEYHSYVGQEQEVEDVLGILKEGGFRVHIHPELVADQPFVERPESDGMDHRLNIFGYRT
jgi:FkbM family methyltransferase